MPKFRATWDFSGAEGSTWSEVYDDGSADATQVSVTRGSPVVIARLKMLHRTCQLDKVTVRDAEAPGKPPLEFRIRLVGTAGDANDPPANTDEAAVIRLSCRSADNLTSSTRSIWIRGLPEAAVARNKDTGRPEVDNAWEGTMHQWLTQLKAANYGMWPRTRSLTGGGAARAYIKDIVGNPGQDVTDLKIDAGFAVVKGDLIQINGTSPKTLPGMRGQFRVVGKTPAGVGETKDTVSVSYRCPSVDPPGSGYFYVLVRPTFCTVVPAQSGFAYLGSRQTKKPLTGSRGRRSAVRLRHSG